MPRNLILLNSLTSKEACLAICSHFLLHAMHLSCDVVNMELLFLSLIAIPNQLLAALFYILWQSYRLFHSGGWPSSSFSSSSS